jgi:hypothetical protein
MNYRTLNFIALGLAHALLGSAQAQTDAGLQAINDLAQVNGQALACQDMLAARRAKALMLAHAPKTARFGNAFDEGTQQSYLAQTRDAAPCPDAAALSTRLDAIAQRLQNSLPTTPQTSKATP